MMVKQKIIDHHGRVENIKLYDRDPTPFVKEAEQAAKLKEKEKAKPKKDEEGEQKDENEEEQKKEELPPPYKTFDNSSATLHDIFDNYGVEMKRELEEDTDEAKAAKGTLYYDFTPFNSKDPVLLSLMTAKNT